MTFTLRRMVVSLLATAWVTSAASAASNLQHSEIASEALGHAVEADIYLPPGFDPAENYRLVILLHGQNDGPVMFQRLGFYAQADKLQAAGEIMPLVMVAPDIGNSFGINSPALAKVTIPEMNITVVYPEGAYEDFLTKDLPAFMAQKYSAGGDADSTVIAGISMGGYAALHIGLTHPDLTDRVAGHSPAIIGREFAWLYPDDAAWQARSLPVLADKYVDAGQVFFVDCGQQDSWGFYPAASQLAVTLKQKGANLEWHDGPGTHGDSYWSRNVADYVRFYGAR